MRQCRGQNIPMGGSLLKEKAKAFAKELGIEFSASEGWLTNFKKRNGIVFKKIAGMDGSEKITPVVIGKSAKPRCFKGINSFPIKYRSKKKAWMTTELFNEWLVSLNSDMKREKRHILLFLDNCTVHNNAPTLSNVKLQFFPPNSTSKLQPLDQDIIHNFKTFYRHEVVKSVLDNLENQQHVTTISILTALIMIDKAWRAITPLTIHNCFKKSGFPSPNLVDMNNTLTEFKAKPSSWEALPEQDLTFDDYKLVDTDIAVGELYLTLKLWFWTTIIQKVTKTNRRS
ncbi:tigger transposable element-derived protein 6 [Trichonephila clavipes]|nr:tigger transposable element-derived protein 6 [Trichonephila clavipes]